VGTVGDGVGPEPEEDAVNVGERVSGLFDEVGGGPAGGESAALGWSDTGSRRRVDADVREGGVAELSHQVIQLVEGAFQPGPYVPFGQAPSRRQRQRNREDVAYDAVEHLEGDLVVGDGWSRS
jgi:hypothetical protein